MYILVTSGSTYMFIYQFFCFRKVRRKCALTGREFDIGFKLIDGTFLLQYTVCFDSRQQITLYTRYSMLPIVTSRKQSNRSDLTRHDLFANLTKPINILYLREVSSQAINRQVGLKDNETYFNTTNRKY